MPVKFSKSVSKSDLPSSRLKMHGNAGICLFTLETAEACNVRKSNGVGELCVFILEPCYLQKPGRMRKVAACDDGIHS
jgi:hypothetical protein